MEDPNAQVECGICYCEYERKDIFTLPCNHYFCRDCLGAHLKANIMVSDFDKLICPQVGCGTRVQPHTMEQIVEPELMEKYRTFQRNQ